MSTAKVRCENIGESIYRIYIAEKNVGMVIANFNTWTAVLGKGEWAWTAPTRRQAVAQLAAHVEEAS